MKSIKLNKNLIKKEVYSKLPKERTQYLSLIAKNPNYFGNIPNSKFKSYIILNKKTTYEDITCVGYNPETENMEATFSVKKTYGYNGDLCTNGSFEHLRFYLDFHDGAGFIDQGVVSMNVHDIPYKRDCAKKSIFPIKYTATLVKKTENDFNCKTQLLPTLRVILAWNQSPPPNAPNWKPVWGNVKECTIQIKPTITDKIKKSVHFPKYAKLLETLSVSPNMTISMAAKSINFDLTKLDSIALEKEHLALPDLIKTSKKKRIPASRYAYKAISKMMKYPDSEITFQQKELLSKYKINYGKIIDELIYPLTKTSTKANISYEELKCLGLDYNTESLVATLKIKKAGGYNGTPCTKGSNEFVSFWIDWNNDCKWEYLDTVTLSVHDYKIKKTGLCYSVSLPLDATHYRKLCKNPNIVRVRSVLSWNTPPSKTDPNKLEFYGNRIDAHVQIKPGIPIPIGTKKALYTIIGGIDVAHVNDSTGLTKSGSIFAFNGLSVPTDAPFGGVIVINGPSYAGTKYQIRVTNLVTGTVSYPTNSFEVVGFLPVAPYSQITTQSVDPAGYYTYLPYNKNILSKLASFSPGTNDLLQVELIIPGPGGSSFIKTIQMDNIKPKIELVVNDGGDCTHYSKGDTITGTFFAQDANIKSWSLSNTWTGTTNGFSNTIASPGVPFNIPTNSSSYPCGRVSLHAVDKTIKNSVTVGFEAYTSYNICLKDK